MTLLADRSQGSWLPVARILWLAVVFVTAAIFVASIPGHLEAMLTVCEHEPCVAGQPSPEDARAISGIGFTLGFIAVYRLVLDFVVALGFCAVGVTIFWRKPRDRGALFVSFALVIFGLTWPDVFDSALVHPVWGGLAGFLTQLGLASLFVFFFVFPDGRFVPRWTRWIVPLAFLLPVLQVAVPDSIVVNPPSGINITAFVALWVCCLAAQIHRYRRFSGWIERQQTKWLVFGVTVLVALLAAFLLPFAAFPSLYQREDLSFFMDLVGLTIAGSLGFLLIPLSIGIAILRYRLFDIDIIINRTLVYGALTISLILTYLGSVVALQYTFNVLTGGGSQLAVVASTLVIAALFNPLRQTIQAFIDRRFYRKKYDAARTLEAFALNLRKETDLESLGDGLITVVEETMQPVQASLWLRDSARDPGDARGRL